MKALLLISLLVFEPLKSLYGQNVCSLDYIKGRWIEQQAEYMQIEWHFHDENNFTMISYYGGEISSFLRGEVYRAKYSLDSSNSVITEKVYEYLNLANGKTFTTDSSEFVTRWKIISCENEELRLMEIQFYEQAVKKKPIDYSKWNTRLLIRPKNLIYLP